MIYIFVMSYRIEDGHYEGEDGAHVDIEDRLLLTVVRVDHDEGRPCWELSCLS